MSVKGVQNLHDGLFCPILLRLDITLVKTHKYDHIESYNLVCW